MGWCVGYRVRATASTCSSRVTLTPTLTLILTLTLTRALTLALTPTLTLTLTLTLALPLPLGDQLRKGADTSLNPPSISPHISPGDQLLKGAALNAVQIAELLLNK